MMQRAAARPVALGSEPAACVAHLGVLHLTLQRLQVRKGFGLQQRGRGLVTQFEDGELGPVGHAHVQASRGVDGIGVVGERGRAIQMRPGCIHLVRVTRGAEACGGDAQRRKHLFLQQLLVGLAASHLGDHAQHRVARVAVLVLACLLGGCRRQHGFHIRAALLRSRSLGSLCGAPHLGWAARQQARAMVQQLVHGHAREVGVDAWNLAA